MSSLEKLKRIRLELPRLEGGRQQGGYVGLGQLHREGMLCFSPPVEATRYSPSAGPCGGQSSVLMGTVDGPQLDLGLGLRRKVGDEGWASVLICSVHGSLLWEENVI